MLHPVLLARRVTGAQPFEHVVTAVILMSAVLIGIETSPSVTALWSGTIELTHQLILCFFVAEVTLRIVSHYPRPLDYFRDPWNLFDFMVVFMSLVPWQGEYAMVGRLLRVLRVVRLVSRFAELRMIVSTLLKSLPSMLHILMLMSLIFYVYAVMGYHAMHDIDPTHWGTLGTALITLFRIVTLEDWTDVMYTAMDAKPWIWIYFISFVIVGTFVVVNLFIAVMLNNLADVKKQNEQVERAAGGELAGSHAGSSNVDAAIEQLRVALRDYEAAVSSHGARQVPPVDDTMRNTGERTRHTG